MSANKKRRSSFVRGRKSLVGVESDRNCSQDQDVDHFLPDGLSENEKRRRLCFEECLLELRREMPHLEEFDQFKVHVRTKVKEKLNELKVEEGEEERVKRSDPVHEAIDRQLTLLPGYIEKLKAEEEAWDEMVKARELLAEKAQARAETVADNPIEFEPTLAISEVDRKLLNTKPDYCAMHRKVVAEFEATASVMEEIPRFVCAVDQAVKTIADRLSKETLRLHEELFPSSEYNPLEILHSRLQYDF